MHTEHTVTGFLTLPQGAIHGQDLFCSSRECFLEGVKFKYCAICDKAVAKRNFKKRHSHHYGEEECSNLPTLTGSKHSFSPCPSSDSSAGERETKQRKISTGPIVSTSSMSTEKQNDYHRNRNSGSRIETPSVWSELYFSRPEDNSAEMQEWLLKVISVSKPSTASKLQTQDNNQLTKPSFEHDQHHQNLSNFPVNDLSCHHSSQNDISLSSSLNSIITDTNFSASTAHFALL